MYEIEEGLISNMAEIYKVSKQVSNPILSILRDLKKARKKSDNKDIRKQIKSQMNTINKSKLSNSMKDKMVSNFNLDMYNILLDNNFGHADVKTYLGWSSSLLNNMKSLAQR